ncbi:MAG: hypothetical protein HFE47_03790 [Clostridia bacterium]|nr:hypothetical protein [Clostridia bacterium]
MSNESKIKKIIRSLKEKKHWEIAIAVIAVVVMLVLYFSTKAGQGKRDTPVASPTVTTNDYCRKTEQELVSALESMRGVGNVKAVVNWESSVERVIAYATSNSGNNITTTPTIITSQGSSSPIVLKELYPKALGVIIICQGGDNVAVKLDIINAVSVLLDISQNKVNVYAMK